MLRWREVDFFLSFGSVMMRRVEVVCWVGEWRLWKRERMLYDDIKSVKSQICMVACRICRESGVGRMCVADENMDES